MLFSELFFQVPSSYSDKFERVQFPPFPLFMCACDDTAVSLRNITRSLPSK